MKIRYDLIHPETLSPLGTFDAVDDAIKLIHSFAAKRPILLRTLTKSHWWSSWVVAGEFVHVWDVGGNCWNILSLIGISNSLK